MRRPPAAIQTTAKIESRAQEDEAGALKADLGEAAYVAETVAVRLCTVLGQTDFHGDAVRIGALDLRCQQPIVDTGGRATNLLDLALGPVVAADQTH